MFQRVKIFTVLGQQCCDYHQLPDGAAELLKVEMLECLLTTGALESATTIALDAMLNLPPLPVLVLKEAPK
jgi:hypothetical protein